MDESYSTKELLDSISLTCHCGIHINKKPPASVSCLIHDAVLPSGDDTESVPRIENHDMVVLFLSSPVKICSQEYRPFKRSQNCTKTTDW